mgnify:CR=1 FL=1
MSNVDKAIILLSLGALSYGLYMVFSPTKVKEAPKAKTNETKKDEA